ncbi:MAG: 1,4-dihydroxy-2-naphthoate polyprenyltransferase [Bacteroidetes bacterium QS_7_67_15]|jgi:1,4-dihydroxy-2-naphthoate octaprenyltransferase|nr:MAG: 1,4-dihydroxy-2-naphthoate polyprenyltransferase [Bacteroidetes bacterium QS_7_67_15]
MNPERSSENPSAVGVWVQAARPQTLGAAVAPVVVGTAMAVEAGAFHAVSALCAALGAVFIQIGTNFSNDYLDFVKGADRESRRGPTRATQAGWVSVKAMRRATILTFALAFASGLYLIWRGGWPVLAIGLCSIASGVWYTAGRWSLAYLGLADLFVLVFFGPVAVGGTYYVQALTVNGPVLVAGMAPGLLATGILLINNLRDREEDARANKKTLVVRFGRATGRRLYAACVIGAALVPVALVSWTDGHAWALAAVGVAVGAAPLLCRLWQANDDPRALNPLLARTARLLVAYSLVFSVGWNL